MSLKCPACGEKTLDMVEYTKRGNAAWSDRAVYVCSSCNHREVV